MSSSVLVLSGATSTYVKNKDILFYAGRGMTATDRRISEVLAINNALSVLV
jgi:hypothetical protein